MKSSFKNIIIGMGSILNIFPKPPKKPYQDMSDEDALRADWEAVCGDFNNAFNQVKKYLPEHER